MQRVALWHLSLTPVNLWPQTNIPDHILCTLRRKFLAMEGTLCEARGDLDSNYLGFSQRLEDARLYWRNLLSMLYHFTQVCTSQCSWNCLIGFVAQFTHFHVAMLGSLCLTEDEKMDKAGRKNWELPMPQNPMVWYEAALLADVRSGAHGKDHQ